MEKQINTDAIYLEKFNLKEKNNGEIINTQIIPIFQIHFNVDTGFGVYNCDSADGGADKTFNISGVFPNKLFLHHTYNVSGTVSTYQKKKQIVLNNGTCQMAEPTTDVSTLFLIKSLLGRNNSIAYKICDKYGSETINIIINEQERVLEDFENFSSVRLKRLSKRLQSLQIQIKYTNELYKLGLTNRDVKKLLDIFNNEKELLEQLQINPYLLSEKIESFTFKRCDEIAFKAGFSPQNDFRRRSGIIHCLKEIASNGHTFSFYNELITKSQSLLRTRQYNFSKEDIEKNFGELKSQNRIIIEEDKVYLKVLFDAEIDIAKKLFYLSKQETVFSNISFEEIILIIDNYLEKNAIVLNEDQYSAVVEATKVRGGIFLIIGDAGAGKTFILNIIINILEIIYKKQVGTFNVSLAAPTGKASKVLKNSTSRDSYTIHRMLGYNPENGFLHNSNNRLPFNIIGIDESSMLDVELASNLFDAIENDTKTFFMGDVKQLPSIGPGVVLRDMIDSGVIKTLKLNVSQRQKENSFIINNANRIINKQPLINAKETDDFYKIYTSDNSIPIKLYESIKRIMKKKNYTLDDIQIIAPQKKGSAGVGPLNYFFQQMFNGDIISEKEKILNKTVEINGNIEQLYFKTKDKVIHTKNDKSMEWYKIINNNFIKQEVIGITNGETGKIFDISTVMHNGHKVKRTIVEYDDGFVFYYGGLNVLDHAYALTIHKSQGSEWPAVFVVFPSYTSQFLAVTNILYTAVTRASEFCCVIGSKSAIDFAIHNDQIIRRKTTLVTRIKNIFRIVD